MKSEVFLAIAFGLALCFTSSHLTGSPALDNDDNLLSQCEGCTRFIPMLLQLSEDRFPHNTEAGHPADHDLCTHRMTDEFKEDCRTVVNQFGLHMVDTLVSENPDSICSLMSSCNSAHLNSLYPDEEVLVSEGVRAQARATAEAAVKQYMATQGNHYQKEWQEAEEALDQENGDDDDEGDEADDDDDDDESDEDEAADQDALETEAAKSKHRRTRRTRRRRTSRRRTNKKKRSRGKKSKKSKKGGLKMGGAETAKHVHNMVGSMMKMVQQRQIMQMQMQQQQMMQQQMMRMRLMGIMASNREMKSRIRHMIRHSPGNCDCCQACPPPPTFGAVQA